MLSKEKILRWGEFIFLAGVSFLIIRNNTYPWPVKRASDILLFVSAVIAFGILSFSKERRLFLGNAAVKKVLAGLALIFAGLIIASVSGYFIDGTALDGGGLLEIGRFVETGIIILLIGFFQIKDSQFYKKAALAQLSTLIYLTAFFLPDLAFSMYRFQLLENWPSNVGYYLIVSLSLLFAFLLKNLERFKKRFFLYCTLVAGLSGILLWTQTRAAWLGIAVSLPLMIFLFFKKDAKKIVSGFSLAVFLPMAGFLMLPAAVKNVVIGRLYPQIYSTVNIEHASPNEILETIVNDKFSPRLEDTRRIFLWNKYSEKLLQRPLGLGVSQNPVEIVGAAQGPHNTILEILALAGPIGLAGFVYLFYLGFKNVLREIRKEAGDKKWGIYICGALIGLIIASMFDNMSTFRILWLLLGLAIFASLKQKSFLGTTSHTLAPTSLE